MKTSLITSCSNLAKPLIAGETNLCTDSLLFCAPEALALPKWRAVLDTPAVFERIVAVVVDEAHCVSKWYINDPILHRRRCLSFLVTASLVPRPQLLLQTGRKASVCVATHQLQGKSLLVATKS